MQISRYVSTKTEQTIRFMFLLNTLDSLVGTEKYQYALTLNLMQVHLQLKCFILCFMHLYHNCLLLETEATTHSN